MSVLFSKIWHSSTPLYIKFWKKKKKKNCSLETYKNVWDTAISYAQHNNFLQNLIMNDQAHFDQYGFVYKQNCRIFVDPSRVTVRCDIYFGSVSCPQHFENDPQLFGCSSIREELNLINIYFQRARKRHAYAKTAVFKVFNFNIRWYLLTPPAPFHEILFFL